MNVSHLILLSVVFLLISSCSSTTKKDDAQCLYADGSNWPAPDWICNKGIHAEALSAVAYADKSAAGKNFMTQIAASAALIKLRHSLSIKVNNMIKQYAKKVGLENDHQLKQILSKTHKLVSPELLTETHIVQQRITPTGSVAVMVLMNEAETLKSGKRLIQSSIKKYPKLWQKLQAKQSQEKLLEAILESSQSTFDIKAIKKEPSI